MLTFGFLPLLAKTTRRRTIFKFLLVAVSKSIIEVSIQIQYSFVFMVCIFLQNNWVCEDDDMPNYVEMVFWCGNIAGFLLWGYTNDRYASLMFQKKLLSLRKSRLFSRVRANLL